MLHENLFNYEGRKWFHDFCEVQLSFERKSLRDVCIFFFFSFKNVTNLYSGNL